MRYIIIVAMLALCACDTANAPAAVKVTSDVRTTFYGVDYYHADGFNYHEGEWWLQLRCADPDDVAFAKYDIIVPDGYAPLWLHVRIDDVDPEYWISWYIGDRWQTTGPYTHDVTVDAPSDIFAIIIPTPESEALIQSFEVGFIPLTNIP